MSVSARRKKVVGEAVVVCRSFHWTAYVPFIILDAFVPFINHPEGSKDILFAKHGFEVWNGGVYTIDIHLLAHCSLRLARPRERERRRRRPPLHDTCTSHAHALSEVHSHSFMAHML